MLVDVLIEILLTAFRLVPVPCESGLRVIGQPDSQSPVFVTCNYVLTVRRVVRALSGIDCFLLIASSKGINVWCGAGGGAFTMHSISSVLKTSQIGAKVGHRTLILPQLASSGIDVGRLEMETGWHCRFGPVYARDIAEYLRNDCIKREGMTRVQFPLRDRLEIVVSWAVPLSILVGVPVAILEPRILGWVMLVLWTFSLALMTVQHAIWTKVRRVSGIFTSLALGLLGALIVVLLGLHSHWNRGLVAGWGNGILRLSDLLGFDWDGLSPLATSATVAYWGRKWPKTLELWARMGFRFEPWFTLDVDGHLCTACGRCVDICPVGVFRLREWGEALVAAAPFVERCVQCTACVKQCPVGAIVAEPPIQEFSARRLHD